MPSCHTVMLRQWTVMCCVTSELSRCRKFIWTRLMANSILEAVMGLRHVCPPCVKLQETSMVSEEQPRFGSTQ